MSAILPLRAGAPPARSRPTLPGATVAALLGGAALLAGLRPYAGLYALLALVALVGPLLLSNALRQPPAVLGVVLGAWAIRCLAMALFTFRPEAAGMQGVLASGGDAGFYHVTAEYAAAHPEWLESRAYLPPYTYVVIGCYALFGPDFNVPELLNVGVGVALVPLVYQLGARCAGARTAVVAALLWAFLPSGVFFSITLMKDAWVVTGAVLAGFLVLGVGRFAPTRGEYAAGAAGIALLGFLRPSFLGAVLLAMALLSFAKPRSGAALLRNLALLALAIGVVFGTPPGHRVLAALSAATSEGGIAFADATARSGGSGIALAVAVPPAFRWLVMLPYVVLAPFPWQWASTGAGFGRLSGLETAVWYAAYLYLAVRVLRGGRRAGSGAVLLFAFALFVASSFTLPNLGSIYRYRLSALVLLSAALPDRRRVPAVEGAAAADAPAAAPAAGAPASDRRRQE
ncbi:MAG TPA: hypothetical protein VFQ38_02455 [Longimicrobiales bacterium]|nr:hypothetical protein [Longimicrobiales bacterium]